MVPSRALLLVSLFDTSAHVSFSCPDLDLDLGTRLWIFIMSNFVGALKWRKLIDVKIFQTNILYRRNFPIYGILQHRCMHYWVYKQTHFPRQSSWLKWWILLGSWIIICLDLMMYSLLLYRELPFLSWEVDNCTNTYSTIHWFSIKSVQQRGSTT